MLARTQPDVFPLTDEFGPSKIIHVSDPGASLKAVVVNDNVAAGAAIGGTRMAPDLTLEECYRLAAAMTLKNASAGLPHGGAKSIIVGDRRMRPEGKERTMDPAMACKHKALCFGGHRSRSGASRPRSGFQDLRCP